MKPGSLLSDGSSSPLTARDVASRDMPFPQSVSPACAIARPSSWAPTETMR
jgi:hypothetical protein